MNGDFMSMAGPFGSPGRHKMLLEKIEELTIKLLAFACDPIIASITNNYKKHDEQAVKIFLET